MKSKTNLLVLIGMPGSGKSEIARALTKKHEAIRCFDTDAMIEAALDISVEEIFRVHQEAYFRALERELIEYIAQYFSIESTCTSEIILSENHKRKLRNQTKSFTDALARGNLVILSTGGGLPIYFDNLEIINKAGTSVYLACKSDTLSERLNGDAKRPLLSKRTWQDSKTCSQGAESLDNGCENKESNNLKKENLNTRISSLLSEREEVYKKASITIDTSFQSLEETTNLLLRSING